MARKIVLTVFLVGGCVWCLALASRAETMMGDPGPITFKPAASIHSLMFGQQTFYKRLKQELAKPATAGRNEDIHHAAEALAELGNVNRHHRDKADYVQWATQLRDIALDLAKEAAKKTPSDDDRMKKLYLSIKQTCADCHDVYQ